MRLIDLTTWPRREHFLMFNAFADPRFDLCAPVEVGALHRAVQARGLPLTAAIVYALSRAANAVPELRCRIRGDIVVEHEVVHPSLTVRCAGDLFSFCQVAYGGSFPAFARDFTAEADRVAKIPMLADPPGRDDLLFMSALPWVAFTSFHHPMPSIPADSIPRFAWGKITAAGDHMTMPLEAQAHHALVDGIHLARWFDEVQRLFDDPEGFLA